MKATNRQVSKGEKIFAVIGGVLFIGLISYYSYLKYTLTENPTYCKAVIVKFYYGGRHRPTIRYEFYVNHIKYTGDEIYYRYKEELLEVGDTCLILYQKDKPDNNGLAEDDNGKIIVTPRRNDSETYEILEPFE